jgi:hypothetical protein
MQNNLLDELIADCAGITAALGYFNADWFLAFVGLEQYPAYRKGGRLQNYRGVPPLSDGAFTILQRLVYHAAKNLEIWTQTHQETHLPGMPLSQLILALTRVTLEELAHKESIQHIGELMNFQP